MEAPVHFEKRLARALRRPAEGFQPQGAAARPASRIAKHAVDFIIDTVRAAPGEITLVTTGPLTNVGMAFLQEPDLGQLLKRMIVLGGTFSTPGNMTPVTEYNIWADPEASRIVLNADVDKILVPLDVCEDNRAATGMMTRDDLADMRAAHEEQSRRRHDRPRVPDLHRHLAGVLRPRRLSRWTTSSRGAGLRTRPLHHDRAAFRRRGARRPHRARPDGCVSGSPDPAGRRAEDDAHLHRHRRSPLHARSSRTRWRVTSAREPRHDLPPRSCSTAIPVMTTPSRSSWRIALRRSSLLGVTTTCGNAEIEKTTTNCLRILEFIGAGDVPVAQGCHRPLARPLVLGTADGPSGLDGSPYLPRAKRKGRRRSTPSTSWPTARRTNRADPYRRDRPALAISGC